jgi:ADP-heptose:LPS heptosyltransferase
MAKGGRLGYGDAILTSSIVKRAYAKVKQPLCVGDGSKVYWSEIFDNNPKIAREPYPGCLWVHDYKGHRAYIDHSKTDQLHTEYRKDYRAEPGEIFTTYEEKQPWNYLENARFALIEPNVKGSYGGNKDWGFDHWQEVVKMLPDIVFLQPVAHSRVRVLDGVHPKKTKTFRSACALLERAYLYVGTDGGLHHAAAAFGKPAVVLWGGLLNPAILGYPTHRNICKAKTFCGSHVTCSHCREAMNEITPEEVADAIRSNYHPAYREPWQTRQVPSNVSVGIETGENTAENRSLSG